MQSGRQYFKGRYMRVPRNAAQSETLSMCGNSLHGNRESLEMPNGNQPAGGSGKASCRTPDIDVSRQSDSPIVPMKQPNKAAVRLTAEAVEGRELTRRTLRRPLHSGHRAGEMRRWVCEVCAELRKRIRRCALRRYCTSPWICWARVSTNSSDKLHHEWTV